MSRYLLMFALMIGSACAAKCQIIDTLCFPVSQVQSLLVAAKQKKVQDTLINVLRSDREALQRTVNAYQVKDSLNALAMQVSTLQAATIRQQKDLLQADVQRLEKQLRRSRLATRATAFGGIALTVLTTLLFVTKN